MNYTILVDNVAHAPARLAEHGLSIWIEHDGRKILLDTGQSDAFLKNAEQLGIDIATADAIVLSHGHYDHTGGLPAALSATTYTTPVYLHPHATLNRYSRHPDGSLHSIGMPPGALAAIEHSPSRFHWISQPTEIFPDIWLTGSVPRTTDFEDTGGDFWLEKACTHSDTVEDDQALIIEDDDQLHIFTGCAHAGVVNIVEYAHRLFPQHTIHALVGGYHLRHASPERIQQTEECLKEFNIRHVLPLHCSGAHLKRVSQAID